MKMLSSFIPPQCVWS